MSDKITKSPKIRFVGFTDAWEERKFIELLDIREGIRRGPFGSALKKELFVPKSDYVVYEQQNAIYDKWETRYNITKDKFDELRKFVLSEGDFIMSGAGTIGRISRVPNGIKQGVFNQALIRFKINTEVTNSNYFLEWIRSDNMQRKFTEANPGSAMTNLVPMHEVKEWVVSSPSLGEQKKIGDFFTELSYLLTLHQRKLELLKDTKKNLLQKMFPKDGANVPEIRFAGFTDVWGQRKLESICGKIRNAFVGVATPYYVEDGHFYLESNNVKDGQINRNKQVFINDEFYKKQKNNWLHTGDLVMVQSGHVGHTAVIPEELDNTAAHALIIFSNYREKVDPYFLNYQFQTHKSKKNLGNITTGNTIKHILASEMKNFQVDIPKYEEQKKIGNFFRQLDDTITLHQRELNSLKNLKKSLIQQMFI
ncbi:restriction endonuclease subunit S [Bacillus velezensis]|uniref:restriction endonuclease subunit S n=1 Tax=Bacillus velezensis TaxID=492670 RepID=UPI00272F078C|nr:restriction endonuclease subunit S [Bacillus velezensis]MDP1498574.1 restriction endonuclease subunit S [Bacillus velezensis]